MCQATHLEGRLWDLPELEENLLDLRFVYELLHSVSSHCGT